MEVKSNDGVLFKNERKTEEMHADYTGSIMLTDGKEYYLNGWRNVSKSGLSYLKVRIGKPKGESALTSPGHSPAYSPPAKPKPKAVAGHGFEDMDDDVPF